MNKNSQNILFDDNHLPETQKTLQQMKSMPQLTLEEYAEWLTDLQTLFPNPPPKRPIIPYKNLKL